jgi:hypothetical protein
MFLALVIFATILSLTIRNVAGFRLGSAADFSFFTENSLISPLITNTQLNQPQKLHER